MRILDNYILKIALSIFFVCLFTFLFLYVIIDVFSHLEDILKNKVGLETLWQYYSSYLPIIFVQVAPIACLLGTLYAFSKLNRDNEIIAMRASGLSVFQITRTIIIFGIITSFFVFWVNDRLVPQSLVFNQKIKEQMESGTKKEQGKEQEVIGNLSMYGLGNRLYFVVKFLPAINTMEGITILEHDEHQDIIRKVVADKGVYSEGVWKFYRSITYEFDKNGQIKVDPQYLEEELMPIPETPHDFLTQRQRPEFMNIAQLNDYLLKLARSGATTPVRNLKVDLYQRIISPFTSLMMIFLGIPFSLMIRKRATGMSSLGLSIMVGFLYYVLNAVSIALGKSGIIMPFLSVSLSHIVAISTSLYFINKLP